MKRREITSIGRPLVQPAAKPLRKRRINWDNVSGAQLAANPKLARRFARETKGCK